MSNSISFKTITKKLLKNPIVIKILAFLIYLYSALVAVTSRWKIVNSKQIDFINHNPAILIGWHARASMLPCIGRRYISNELYALASPHQDGQIIANFLKLFKIKIVCGSTNERSTQSALEIMRLLNSKKSIFITPDGPRGPRMRMKKSPIYFASHSGLPIIFITYSASNAFIIKKAWDKTFVPLPFSNGCFALSDPFYVPSDISDDEIERYRLELEEIANKTNIDCDKKVGREPILPATPDEVKTKKYRQGNP